MHDIPNGKGIAMVMWLLFYYIFYL